jgi:RNA polymerase sigma factor (sigma-70 family)
MRVSVANDEASFRQLMLASLDGDALATRALLAGLVPVLRGYYSRRVRSDADIEDIVQDTLIAVHTRRASYDPTRPFAPWLFAVARHKMVDHHRRARIHLALDDVAEIESEDDFASAVTARLDIETGLAALGAKQAAVIRATRIDGASVAEVAAREGLSESDVKVSVHRGIKAMTKRIFGT